MQTEIEMLMRKLDSIADLSDEDRQTLSSLALRVTDLQPDEDVLGDGEVPRACCLLIEGFMHRYKLLPDGRRQILAFHTPGDIPDLQSLALNIMDHSVAALVRCKVAYISHDSLWTVMRTSPGIAQALWRDTLIDAAIFRTWITSMGRR